MPLNPLQRPGPLPPSAENVQPQTSAVLRTRDRSRLTRLLNEFSVPTACQALFSPDSETGDETTEFVPLMELPHSAPVERTARNRYTMKCISEGDLRS